MKILKHNLQIFTEAMIQKFQERDVKHGVKSVTNSNFNWAFNQDELENHLIKEMGE